MSTQLAKMTTSYDAELPASVDRIVATEDGGMSLALGPGLTGRAQSTHSVGAEFYFKDVLFTQETPEFIL